MANKYKNMNPRYMWSRYAGHCSSCGEYIPKTSDVFYYPTTKKIYFGVCAETASQQYRSITHDENMISMEGN